MVTVSKSVLKSKMLAIFREIESSGEELLVTDNNRPVLKVVPLKNKKLTDLFASYRGKMTYREALDKPTQSEWSES